MRRVQHRPVVGPLGAASTTWSRPRRFLLGGLVILLTGGSVGCVPEPPPPPTVAVYGDSLVNQSSEQLDGDLQAALPGWQVALRAFPGTAQCDWHSMMADDADAMDVRVVVIAFTGNRLTPCALERPYPDSYEQDAEWAADFWSGRGATVVFVATPGLVGTDPAERVVPNRYLAVAARRGIAVADPTPLFVDPTTGRYASEAPCLVGECATSTLVRAPDGLHLCPADCSVSSGVVRYAGTIARATALAAGVVPPPAFSMVTPPATTSTTAPPRS